jgi:hypothetical protein
VEARGQSLPFRVQSPMPGVLIGRIDVPLAFFFLTHLDVYLRP